MLAQVRDVVLRSGDYSVLSGATAYRGGSPARMGTGGTLDVATYDTGNTAFVGVFANCQAVDQLPGYDVSLSGTGTGVTVTSVYKSSVIHGPSRLRLTSGVRRGVADGYPYDSTLTYVPGDMLYIGTGGTWVNVAPQTRSTEYAETGVTSGWAVSVAHGIVEASGSNYIDVLFYGR